MEGYLGEFPVDVTKHKTFKKFTPADWAMYFVERYGQIDGGHHKQWVLDQVARCLKGVPVIVVEARWSNGEREDRVWTSEAESPEYKKWVKAMKGKYDKENEEYEYDYDTGIAP